MKALWGKFQSFLYNPVKHVESESRIVLSSRAMLMKGCRFKFCHQGGKISIGEESLVGCQFILEHPEGSIRVGKRCFLNAGSYLISAAEIEIGDDVTVAWGVSVYDHNSHSLDWRERARDNALQNANFRKGLPIEKDKNWESVKRSPVRIGNKCWIGFNAVILRGVTLGEGSIVAAGSVVFENVAPWTVVAGNPARAIRSVNQEGHSLD